MATRTYPRLILTSGQTYIQPAGDTIIILEYVSGDWDGAIFASDTPGTPFMLNVPAAGISVIGCTFTDCDASGGGDIDATNGGIDGGGNSVNISFPAVSSGGIILHALYEDDKEE